MNYYKQSSIKQFELGGLRWEFGEYETTGLFYIKCLDMAGVSKTINIRNKALANEAAGDFVEEFLETNR